MAKSARASGLKKNKAGLKKKVFGPVEAARQQRLNAKLLALAQLPKPANDTMTVETSNESAAVTGDAAATTDRSEAHSASSTAMEVDDSGKTSKSKSGEVKDHAKPRRVQKTRHRKAKNELTFRPTGVAKAKKNRKR